jgi:hypothetical protein
VVVGRFLGFKAGPPPRRLAAAAAAADGREKKKKKEDNGGGARSLLLYPCNRPLLDNDGNGEGWGGEFCLREGGGVRGVQ